MAVSSALKNKEAFAEPVYDETPGLYQFEGVHELVIQQIKHGFMEDGREALIAVFEVAETDSDDLRAGETVAHPMVQQAPSKAAPKAAVQQYWARDVRKFLAAALECDPNDIDPDDVVQAAYGDVDLNDLELTEGSIDGAEDGGPLKGSRVKARVAEKSRRNKSGELKTFTEIRYSSAS
jgi:hypothetical protein